MNIYDANLVATIFQHYGFEKSTNIHESEFIILQTCSVRKHAEDRIRNKLVHYTALKKKRPDLKIILSGCLAQHKAIELAKEFQEIDLIVGTGEYLKIKNFLENRCNKKINIELDDKIDYSDLYSEQFYSDSNAYIPIMRGCNNFCSYCIVPYLRGRERSRKPQDIINEINKLNPNKFKEITLLGQNVNSYMYGNIDFPELLRLIDENTDFKRIRFLTSHPKDISIRLIEQISKLNSLCEHIHLPVQSGSNKILKLMNRNYTRESYIEKIRLAKEIIDKVSLSTDIIVGFPGEDEDDFKETLELLDIVGFEDAFMYKYSKREGTAAALIEETLTEEEKVKRLNKLIKYQLGISNKVLHNRIGDIMEVLIEGRSKKNENEFLGRSRENIMVVFPSNNKLKMYDICNVKITGVSGKTLRGELI